MDTTAYRDFLRRIVNKGTRLDEAVGLGLIDPAGHLKSVAKKHGGGEPILSMSRHVTTGLIPHPKGDLDTARSMAEHTARATGGKVYKTYADHWETDEMIHTGYGISGKTVTGKNWEIEYSPFKSLSDHMKDLTGEPVHDPEGMPSGVRVSYHNYYHNH